jgi:hypothetical protein
MLDELQPKLARIHRLRVELHSRRTFALDLAFDPHQYLGVDRLRTGVAAEESPAHGGDQEQSIGGNHQQNRQIDDVLRPEDQAENVELAFDDMEENRLPAVPFEPAQAIEQSLGKEDHRPAPVIEEPRDAADVDGLVLLVQGIDVDGNCLGLAAGRLVHDLGSNRFQNYSKL